MGDVDDRSNHLGYNAVVTDAHQPKLLERTPVRAAILLGVPLVFASFFQVAFNFVEVRIFGGIGDQGASMAGAATSDMITSIFALLASGIGNAAVAEISHARGVGDTLREGRHVRQALFICIVLSLASVVVGLLAGPIGWAAMGDIPAREPGTAFLRIMAIGGFGTIFMVMAIALLRARGDTVRPLILVAVVSMATLFLEAVFVLGWFGVEPAGLAAAAWVTVGMRALITVWGVWMINRQMAIAPPDGESFVHGPSLRKQLRLGLVSAVQQATRIGGMLALIVIASHGLSPAETEPTFNALNIWSKVDLPLLMIAFAWGGGVAPLVGTALGANRPDYAKRAIWGSVGAGIASALVLTGVILLFGEPIVRWLVPDATAATIASTVSLLSHVSLVYSMMVIGIIIAAAFNGAGDMKTPLKWDLAILLVVQCGLAWLLSRSMGATGLYVALVVSGVLQGIVPTFIFLRTQWHTEGGVVVTEKRSLKRDR